MILNTDASCTNIWIGWLTANSQIALYIYISWGKDYWMGLENGCRSVLINFSLMLEICDDDDDTIIKINSNSCM